MIAVGRSIGVVVLAVALGPVTTPLRAQEIGADHALPVPGLPGLSDLPFPGQSRPSDRRGGDVRSPNADIYHEYGTVTPGGGAHRGGRVQDFGGLVIGPGGVVKPSPAPRQAPPPPKPLTPEQRQAKIRKALTPPPPRAVMRRKTLDDLYAKLAAAGDGDEAKGVAAVIEAVWARSGSDTADLLMTRADKAVATRDYALALQVLDKVVALQPDWAEAWNRRATVRYLSGDLNGAMADVDHVLKLEPRHFGALNGLAMILQRTGFDKRALQVYRRELAIYPHQPDIEQLVEKLTSEVEGQGI